MIDVDIKELVSIVQNLKKHKTLATDSLKEHRVDRDIKKILSKLGLTKFDNADVHLLDTILEQVEEITKLERLKGRASDESALKELNTVQGKLMKTVDREINIIKKNKSSSIIGKFKRKFKDSPSDSNVDLHKQTNIKKLMGVSPVVQPDIQVDTPSDKKKDIKKPDIQVDTPSDKKKGKKSAKKPISNDSVDQLGVLGDDITDTPTKHVTMQDELKGIYKKIKDGQQLSDKERGIFEIDQNRKQKKDEDARHKQFMEHISEKLENDEELTQEEKDALKADKKQKNKEEKRALRREKMDKMKTKVKKTLTTAIIELAVLGLVVIVSKLYDEVMSYFTAQKELEDATSSAVEAGKKQHQEQVTKRNELIKEYKQKYGDSDSWKSKDISNLPEQQKIDAMELKVVDKFSQIMEQRLLGMVEQARGAKMIFGGSAYENAAKMEVKAQEMTKELMPLRKKFQKLTSSQKLREAQEKQAGMKGTSGVDPAQGKLINGLDVAVKEITTGLLNINKSIQDQKLKTQSVLPPKTISTFQMKVGGLR